MNEFVDFVSEQASKVQSAANMSTDIGHGYSLPHAKKKRSIPELATRRLAC
jgi:hypothetical protein